MKKILLTLVFTSVLLFILAVPRNLVVVEIGTGTWCPYCPGAAMGADDLIDAGQPVAIVENHNGDTFANVYSNARNSYYGITGYPTAFFDGQNSVVGGSNTQSMYANYLPRVTSRIAVPSKYTISATGNLTGNNLTVAATVAKPEADTNTNVLLHCVITQSHIQYSWQGQTHLNFVNRLMLPNQSGTAVTLATGEQQTYNLTGIFNLEWDITSCEAVLFLQNNATKEILQGVKYSLPELLGINPISVTELNFPETYIGGSSSLSFTINNYFNFPVTGTISSSNPVFIPEQTNFSIAAYQATTINVNFVPASAVQYTGILTLNSNLSGFNIVQIPLSGTGFFNAPPSVSNLIIVGPPVIYQGLTVLYDFSDPDGNVEGNSRFQWMRMFNNQPQVIQNAVQQTYIIQPEDMDYPIACQVTPVDQHGMEGTPVLSPPTIPIEDLPAPQNLTGTLTPPNTVILHWQKPIHYQGKVFSGYRIYRDGTSLYSLMNPDSLSYVDLNVPDGSHTYWVCSIFTYPLVFSNPSNSITINVNVPNSDELAPALKSVSVYPNPFKATTNFQISGKANRSVTIEIYNLKGQLINRLTTKTDQNGSAQIGWNALDENAKPVRNGIYFFRTLCENFCETGKLILLK
ncbi:MAG: Omp28-related outer membrane protein [Candidatus Cloacimonas acidaminovorans]|nr:Omp28-related outer membrane protein [Candidatus Cloacimonas acidaminovorans]